MIFVLRCLLSLTVFSGSILLPLRAQSFLPTTGNHPAIALEVLKTSVRGEQQTGSLGSAWIVSGYMPTPVFNILLEIPFAYADGAPNFNSSTRSEDEEGALYVGRRFTLNQSSEFTLGNIFIGASTRKGDSSGVWAEAGFRLPNAVLFEDGKGAASALGLFGDYVNRLEAFAPEYASLIAVLRKHKVNKTGFSYHLNGGLSVLLPTRDKDIGPEWYLLYGIHVIKEDRKGALYAGIDGRIIMSREPNYFSDQTTHQLSVRALLFRNRINPGLYFHKPFDKNLTEVVNWTIGLSVQVKLLNFTVAR